MSPADAVAPAVLAVSQRAIRSSAHAPATTAVAGAQAAAIQPTAEQQRGAAVATVGNLETAQEQSAPFERTSFKAALQKAIDDATPTPTTEDQANQVITGGAQTASAALGGTLQTQQDAAAGPLQNAAAAEVPPDQVAAAPAPPLALEQAGPPPEPVSAAPVVPAPLPAARLDYSADRQPTEAAMAAAEVTPDQLAKGNEPAFSRTLDLRTGAEQHEAQAASTYRETEAGQREAAANQAQTTLAGGLTAMHAARTAAVGTVGGQLTGTQTKDAAERRRITETVDRIKNETRADVEKLLQEMETEASHVFSEGLTAAEVAYQDAFEEAKGGVGTWLSTWGDDWEEHITNALVTARREYLRHVELAIDKVADRVDGKLAAAKNRIAAGRLAIRLFVDGLDASVKGFGEQALASVAGEFTAMSESIDARKDALVNSLTSQYKASYERMLAMETQLREANKSLWQRVYDATVGLVEQILAFKNMLLSALAKAGDVIGDIIADPIGFLKNLVDGVMLGLRNFLANIGKHLQKGLMDWLFGALAGAGLTMPEKFDLQGIVSIVLQVLGLTYANFRARAVKIVGEEVVSGIEKAAEVFRILLVEGVPGLWRFIKDKVGELKSMVLDAIFDFIKEKVIVAGITWIIGLLNPASAFFKACKAIYDIIMFFINRGSQILALVTAVLDSMGAIAKGSIGVAAKYVEDSLGKAVPVAIGFLAGLLGLGDISESIRKVIDKAQAPVNKAIDWVITQAVKLVKAAGKLIRGGFEDEREGDAGAGADSADVLELATAEIDTRLNNPTDVTNVDRVLKDILAGLSSSGLHGLRLEETEEGFQFVGEASPGKVLRRATRLGELDPSVRTRPQMHVGATIRFDDEVSAKSKPMGAIESTIHESPSGHRFSYQGRQGIPGQIRARGHGGAVFHTDDPNVLTSSHWNTSDNEEFHQSRSISDSSSDHAEQHFVAWLTSIEDKDEGSWLRIREITLVNDPFSPCPDCAAALEGIAKHISRKKQASPHAPNLKAMLFWRLPWTGQNRTLPHTLAKMDHWIVSPDRLPSTGDYQEDALAKIALEDRAVRKGRSTEVRPSTVIRRKRA